MRSFLPRALAFGAAVGIALGVTATGNAVADTTVTTSPIKVAAVSAPSVEFDLAASLVRADEITAEAAAAGAQLLTFGELWLPGFPKQINHDSTWAASHFADYVANSITIGDASWNELLNIAERHHVYLSIGFAEHEGDHLYMAQALIGPDGNVVEKRRKIRPSGTERQFFSDDTMEGNLDVAQTTLGRIGMLECWEHLHAQMTYPLQAKGENIHIAAWPYNPLDNTNQTFWEDSRVAESAARLYAITGGAWVVSPAAGSAFIMNPQGQIVAQSAAGDDFITTTIDPAGFGGGDKYDPRSEYSWGVLEMIGDTYPESARVVDAEHSTLNQVSLETLGFGAGPGAPSASPAPTGGASPAPNESMAPTPAPTQTAAAIARRGGNTPAGGLALTGGGLAGSWGLAAAGTIAVGLAAMQLARRSRTRATVHAVIEPRP